MFRLRYGVTTYSTPKVPRSPDLPSLSPLPTFTLQFGGGMIYVQFSLDAHLTSARRSYCPILSLIITVDPEGPRGTV